MLVNVPLNSFTEDTVLPVITICQQIHFNCKRRTINFTFSWIRTHWELANDHDYKETQCCMRWDAADLISWGRVGGVVRDRGYGNIIIHIAFGMSLQFTRINNSL